MRVPVAVTLESRDGTVSKDAKVLNGVVETKGEQVVLRKRQGLSDLGQIWTTGSAQLLYSWNGLWAIYGDVLRYGTSSTILSPTFTTWNASDKGSDVTLSNGNLTASFSNTVNVMVRASQSLSSGKYYWEVTVGTASANGPLVGIAKSGATLSNYLGEDANGWAYQANGNKINNASGSAYGSTFTTGDIIGVALDCDNGTLSFYKNGVSQGQAYSSLSGTFYPASSGGTTAANGCTANFGATAFTYSPPTGYTAGVPTSNSTSLGSTTGGLRFDAQEVGPSASTQLMMVKNRTQAWTVTKAGVRSAISFPSSMGAATYPVSSLTRSGTTATAVLVVDPSVGVGDSITVAGANQSSYNVTTTVTAVAGATAAVVSNTSSITRSGTTATVVTATPHQLSTDGTATIANAYASAYNGTKTVTVVDANTFTFTVSVTAYSAYGAAVTWNASDKDSHVTLSNGNLTTSIACYSDNTTYSGVRATAGQSTGVKYWEVTLTTTGYEAAIGIASATASLTALSAGTVVWYGLRGIYSDGVFVNSIPSGFTTGDVIGVRLDMTNGVVSFFKNGVFVASKEGLIGTLYPIIYAHPVGVTGFNVVATTNFGATSFTYNYDDPYAIDPNGVSATVTKPAASAQISYTVSGSPTTPATGTITLTTNGGMVPGLPYIDGYFFVMDQNGVMWQSNSDDPTTWGSLNFLTAQNENGKGKALAKSLNYLIAFKEWSTEFFYDAKNATGFAFSPVDNGFTQIGCAHGDSVTKLDGNLIWLSQVKEFGRGVHLMTGLQVQKVSTPDVDRILNQDNLSTVYAMGVKVSGHAYYVLTLVNSNITLVYDLTSQAWTQWSSLTAGNAQSITSIVSDGSIATVTFPAAHGLSDGDPLTIAGSTPTSHNGIKQVSYVSSTVVTFPSAEVGTATGTITGTAYTSSYFKFTKYTDYLGANLFLHETNGHLYQMLPTVYQDAGMPIDVFARSTRLDGGSTEVKVMSRVTLIGDKISDTAMVRWSDDDSQTFSAYRSVDLSLERPSLRRCGKFRRRSVEIRHVGNTPPRIEALELEIPQ